MDLEHHREVGGEGGVGVPQGTVLVVTTWYCMPWGPLYQYIPVPVHLDTLGVVQYGYGGTTGTRDIQVPGGLVPTV